MPWSSASSEAIGGLQRTQPLLGTFVCIRVAEHGVLARMALSAAFDAVARIHRSMSFHDPDSSLSRLNREAQHEPQPVDPDLARVLRASLALSQASDGSFDPTVAWHLVQRGHLPSPSAKEVDPLASWRDVRLLRDGRVHYRRPLWLDLGGIAKGYAVDRAVRALRHHGMRAGTVNAGGDLRVFGGTETIHVRDPADPRRHLPLLIARDAAVATSAGYFSPHGGNTALIDVQNGGSLGERCSVTVCAPRAIWADALTKVVLAKKEASVAVLQRLSASALILERNGSRRRVG